MHESTPDKNTDIWIKKAISAVIKAEKMLWGKHNESIQAWMYESGFYLTTMHNAHLGWQLRNTQRPAEGWGLSTPGKIHIPEGITIPIIVEKSLQRVVIYRMGHGHDGEYHTVEGSAPVPLVLKGNPEKVALVRGELDALLLHQELKGEWTVAATGSLPTASLQATLQHAKETRLIAMEPDAELLAPWGPLATQTHTLSGESLIALARSGSLSVGLTAIFG